MKTIMTALAVVLTFAGVAMADTKTLVVYGVPTEVKLSASGGFYNIVAPVETSVGTREGAEGQPVGLGLAFDRLSAEVENLSDEASN